jgi:hypothetical protein
MSIGYFIYDTICCMAIDLDLANLLHHACSLLGMAVGIVQGRVRRVCYACEPLPAMQCGPLLASKG